jgi:hypothetical protein
MRIQSMDLSPPTRSDDEKKRKQYVESIRAYLMRAGASLDTAKGLVENLLTEMKLAGAEGSMLRTPEDAKIFVEDVIRLANDAIENLERARK